MFCCGGNGGSDQAIDDSTNGVVPIYGVVVMKGRSENYHHPGEGLYDIRAAFYKSESDLERYHFAPPDIEIGHCTDKDIDVLFPTGDNAFDVGPMIIIRLSKNPNYRIRLFRGNNNNVYSVFVEGTILPDNQVWDVEVPSSTLSEERIWEGAFFAPKLTIPTVVEDNEAGAATWREGNCEGDLYVQTYYSLCAVEDTGLFILPSDDPEPSSLNLIRVAETTTIDPLQGNILSIGFASGNYEKNDPICCGGF
jgi:hypothetical protein